MRSTLSLMGTKLMATSTDRVVVYDHNSTTTTATENYIEWRANYARKDLDCDAAKMSMAESEAGEIFFGYCPEKKSLHRHH